MPLTTEPIGSIPRPTDLLAAVSAYATGGISREQLHASEDAALRETIALFERTGSPVISDGEQTKPSFATYPLSGLSNLATAGVVISFADGHTRQLPTLTAGPFHHGILLRAAQKYARRPLKQAVISASALSLLYPQGGLPGYPQQVFPEDLVKEASLDIRECLDAGAAWVQIEFTEGRLALKLDPSVGLLNTFIELNKRVLDRFTAAAQQRIGVHTCPGGDHDSTHSADVGYTGLLPSLFRLNVGGFYIQLSSEPDRPRVLRAAREHHKPGQVLFIGVTDPIKPRWETPEEIRDRVLEATRIIPVESLGTIDECGFSPFADDTSTTRDTAFAKVKSRVEGTLMASNILKV